MPKASSGSSEPCPNPQHRPRRLNHSGISLNLALEQPRRKARLRPKPIAVEQQEIKKPVEPKPVGELPILFRHFLPTALCAQVTW